MIGEYGLVRVGVAVPDVRAADIANNVASMQTLAATAAKQGCDVVLFPELCITGYTCADLFSHELLLRSALKGLEDFAADTAGIPSLLVVGLPLEADGQLFNTAVVLCRGHILGVVPKSYLPGYHEYYEPRWFAADSARIRDHIALLGRDVPFGADLLFRDTRRRRLCLGIEICEDLWAPVPPSSYLALAGANLILNPSASNDVIGKSEYRLDLVRQQSARCLAAYAYCSAGVGESTTDVVFAGDCLVAENGVILSRAKRFEGEAHLTTADVDLAFLQHERISHTTFGQSLARGSGPPVSAYREILFEAADFGGSRDLDRSVDPRPFVPADSRVRHERCQEILAIQSTGLATRLRHTGLRHVVLGLSGGLDSTLALLVCIEAFKRLDLDVAGLHAITMPGFGTTERTLGNVQQLCRHLGVRLESIRIDASCKQHFRDIGHDGTTPDVTYENVQARERTKILMNKANMVGGLVVGTGDLSELALGWCTYNGDHMSMYAVNAGVPKTLVSFLIEYYADDKAEAPTAEVLRDILATPISPELLPPDAEGNISQKTEKVLGPYELHDFFLYSMIRRGYSPKKTLYLARYAFADTYPEEEIIAALTLFCRRFFSQQFKRSCLPDGPKVGTIALSPRGDWRMPSDASSAAWLAELDSLKHDAPHG